MKFIELTVLNTGNKFRVNPEWVTSFGTLSGCQGSWVSVGVPEEELHVKESYQELESLFCE